VSLRTAQAKAMVSQKCLKSKIKTKPKKEWDIAQVVDCLPSTHKALGSVPSTTKIN
jgi:hypothetical protein